MLLFHLAVSPEITPSSEAFLIPFYSCAVCTDHSSFHQALQLGHLGSFQSFAVTDNAVMNTLCLCFSMLLEVCLPNKYQVDG